MVEQQAVTLWPFGQVGSIPTFSTFSIHVGDVTTPSVINQMT